MSSYTFIIVGKNDNPIYEAEFSSGQKVLSIYSYEKNKYEAYNKSTQQSLETFIHVKK